MHTSDTNNSELRPTSSCALPDEVTNSTISIVTVVSRPALLFKNLVQRACVPTEHVHGVGICVVAQLLDRAQVGGRGVCECVRGAAVLLSSLLFWFALSCFFDIYDYSATRRVPAFMTVELQAIRASIHHASFPKSNFVLGCSRVPSNANESMRGNVAHSSCQASFDRHMCLCPFNSPLSTPCCPSARSPLTCLAMHI